MFFDEILVKNTRYFYHLSKVNRAKTKFLQTNINLIFKLDWAELVGQKSNRGKIASFF